MIKLIPGTVQEDSYDGQKIWIYTQANDEDISLFSAKTDGKVTLYSLQLMQNIQTPGIDMCAKMNANYFVNQPGTAQHGMALGVRCGYDEWEVPRQSAWYYYALLKDGTTHALMDTAFWYTRDDCVFACSPAEILLMNGNPVNFISPSAEGSKSYPNTQSMLIRAGSRFAFAVCTGKVVPEQCRQWALTIEGIQDLCLMDSGGSSCMEVDGEMIVATTRPISNVLAFYKKEVKPEDDRTTLNGIDISNWQAGIDLTKLNFDFVIAKATEGVNFVDKYCDGFIQTAKKMGKLWGFYHFARPTNDAVTEARYFVNHTLNYFGEGIPVLDWEAENKNDVQWALRWLNEVKRLTGIKPLIYMSEYVVNVYDWSDVVKADYGLWVAKYRDKNPDYNYDMSTAGPAPSVRWWSGYAMWQWTSVGHLNGYAGSLDCDVFYGNSKTWKAYATSKPVTDEPEEPETIESLKARIVVLEEENAKYLEQITEYASRIDKAIKVLKGEEK